MFGGRERCGLRQERASSFAPKNVSFITDPLNNAGATNSSQMKRERRIKLDALVGESLWENREGLKKREKGVMWMRGRRLGSGGTHLEIESRFQ